MRSPVNVDARPLIDHVLYLHGFRSSPRSAKATLFADWMRTHRPDAHWCCPPLPPSPAEAVELLCRLTDSWTSSTMAVVGSSLGGFYATVMAERRGCRAALLNPAVDPARDLARHIGATTTWRGDEPFFFRAEFIDELKRLTPSTITMPERYVTLIAKGDEVLAWREMSARYAGCPGLLLEGGDHAISDFAQHLPTVARLLGLTSG